MHLPNIEQNAFETFHFISNGRLDIVELVSINTCSKKQMLLMMGLGLGHQFYTLHITNQNGSACPPHFKWRVGFQEQIMLVGKSLTFFITQSVPEDFQVKNHRTYNKIQKFRHGMAITGNSLR